MILVTATTTNNVNDDEVREYKICASEDEKNDYITHLEEQIETWNYNTPGAQSRRYLDTRVFYDEQYEYATVSDLSMLTITDFSKLITYISNIKQNPLTT